MIRVEVNRSATTDCYVRLDDGLVWEWHIVVDEPGVWRTLCGRPTNLAQGIQVRHKDTELLAGTCERCRLVKITLARVEEDRGSTAEAD